MAKILTAWIAHCDALSKLNTLLESLSEVVPATGTGRKMRTAIVKAWGSISETSTDIDEMLTESVQPLPVDFPWHDKDFTTQWGCYKDYLLEQHGIVMRSRMEQARLAQILQFAKDDRDLFMRTINYYMACGSAGVFAVNFEGVEPKAAQGANTTGAQGGRAKVTISLSDLVKQ